MEWKHISDKEVWSIPAGSTIAAIEDPECRIYECPIDYAEVEASYISFRGKAGGKADTVYKIKDICNGVNVSDPNELNALYAEKPEYKARLQKYLSIVHPEGVRLVFFLDDASSDINLLYPVMPKRNNSFKSFYHMADFIKEPDGKDEAGKPCIFLPSKA